MKIIYIVLISMIFIFSVCAQEKPENKNATNNQINYSKEKAEQVNTKNNEETTKDNRKNKLFGSSKNSGSEVILKKENNQNTITNEELGRNLNNPQKIKK